LNIEIHEFGALREDSYDVSPKLPKPPDDTSGGADVIGSFAPSENIALVTSSNRQADDVKAAETSQVVSQFVSGVAGRLLPSVTTGGLLAAAQMFGDVLSEPTVSVEADLPLPFTESARAEGCRCVEHRGGGGFNAGAWTSKQRPLDCRCVGSIGDNVPSDLGDNVVKL
ncbi:unnamed protein product, partial [Ixodes hexagonus]